MRRAVRRGLKVTTGALVGALAVLGFLWMRADFDGAYLWRVLRHRESSTDDYRWKASAPVAAASSPAPWPEAPACPAVAAAFAGDADAADLGAYLTGGGTLALVVIRDGAIACEWYGNGGARDRPAAAFSVSKTVVALLLARAVAAHQLASLDEPITLRVPTLQARDPRFATITLAELVDMRSGIAFEEEADFPWVDRDSSLVYYASDLAQTVVDKPRIASAPGPFVYNDYAPNLTGLALERATGASLAAGPMQALWTELGAEAPAAWSVDAHGYAWHESGLVVTARDLARVGQLMLTGGLVGARPVAPAAFLARSFDPAGRAPATTFGATTLGYRNGWWVFDDNLVAMGRYGQIMIVAPAARTVIVRLGLDGHAETNVALAQRFLRVADRLRSR